jgi:hypothetical protein
MKTNRIPEGGHGCKADSENFRFSLPQVLDVEELELFGDRFNGPKKTAH